SRMTAQWGCGGTAYSTMRPSWSQRQLSRPRGEQAATHLGPNQPDNVGQRIGAHIEPCPSIDRTVHTSPARSFNDANGILEALAQFFQFLEDFERHIAEGDGFQERSVSRNPRSSPTITPPQIGAAFAFAAQIAPDQINDARLFHTATAVPPVPSPPLSQPRIIALSRARKGTTTATGF